MKIFLALIVFLFLASPCEALYKFVDNEGTTHITNSMESIPPQYRFSAIEVRDDSAPQGYTPSFEDAQKSFGQQGAEQTWFNYQGLKWHEQTWLHLRVGAKQYRQIVKDNRFVSLAIVVGMIAMIVWVSFSSKTSGMRTFLVGVVISVALLALGSLYVKESVSRGSKTLQGYLMKKHSAREGAMKAAEIEEAPAVDPAEVGRIIKEIKQQ